MEEYERHQTKDLARTLNVSEAAISNIENDVANIAVTQLGDIAIALNVSVEQLLDPHQKLKMPFPQAAYFNPKKMFIPSTGSSLDAIIASMEKRSAITVAPAAIHPGYRTLLKHELPVFNAGSREATRAWAIIFLCYYHINCSYPAGNN